MNDREREELTEVLAKLYDAEKASNDKYGEFHPKAIAARRSIESLLDDEREIGAISIGESVTLRSGAE